MISWNDAKCFNSTWFEFFVSQACFLVSVWQAFISIKSRFTKHKKIFCILNFIDKIGTTSETHNTYYIRQGWYMLCACILAVPGFVIQYTVWKRGNQNVTADKQLSLFYLQILTECCVTEISSKVLSHFQHCEGSSSHAVSVVNWCWRRGKQLMSLWMCENIPLYSCGSDNGFFWG